jgi:putative transposase
MSAANPRRGALRIHGEMLRLGIEDIQAPVGRHLVRRHGQPSPTWQTFVRIQIEGIAAIEMFVVATAAVLRLYAIIILGQARRK